ncbi:MAG: cation diffusion facilitator family transporter [Cyanobacteria bacterium SZAS LIN-2]|nr:cation diffusion facilitator family transporter [Cyanobacteria bacterium SZAS LIN-2]
MKAFFNHLKTLAVSPFAVMWMVVGMYAVKAVLKIGVGQHIHSPMIAGDGFHNMADILEALAVLLVIWISKRPSSDDYPFGKKNVEFFTSLAIGTVLLVMSFNFALQSLSGLLALFPQADQAVRSIIPLPEHHPLLMDPGTFKYVVALALGSVIASLLVSRHQKRVGKASGHASMVADGEETASDGIIELITLLGVLGEYFFHAPWLEYPLGLLVAGVIAHTGWELFMGGFRVLLQHSIGAEHEAEIRKCCLSQAGVMSVDTVKTFQIGSTAVCMLTVVTEHNTSTIAQMKYGLEHALKGYILAAGFKDCELHFKFQKPEPNRHRVAFAVVNQDNHLVVASTVEQASHVIICDVEHGDIVRSKQEPKPAATELSQFLKRKRVTCFYLFHSQPEAVEGITVATAPSFQAHLVGLNPRSR